MKIKNILSIVLCTWLPLTSINSVLAAESTENNTNTKTTLNASEDFRKNPPKLPNPRPLQLPKVENFKLSNDLDVYMVPSHKVPYITAYLGVKAGSVNDPVEKLGLCELTSSMLTEGCDKLTSKEFAQKVDFIGAGIDGYSSQDFTFISAQGLSQYTPKLFELFAKCVIKPEFNTDELKLKKANLIQTLTLRRTQPNFLANERFSKVIYGNHPYSIIAPNEATVNKISQLDLKTFHSKYYVPNNSVLVVVGDFDSEKLKQIIKDNFDKDWTKKAVPPKHMPVLANKQKEHIYLVDRPNSVQSNIWIGNLGIDRQNPDYFPFIVANEILGGSSRSRLFLNIREQKGYTYGAYSNVKSKKSAGEFVCSAEVRNNVTGPSLQEFLYELERMRNVAVSEKELKEAQNHLAGVYQLAVETQSGLASKLIDAKLHNLPLSYLTDYADKIMAVTPNKIQQVIRKYVDMNKLSIVIVGDKKEILSQLAPFCEISTFDTNGQSLSNNKSTVSKSQSKTSSKQASAK